MTENFSFNRNHNLSLIKEVSVEEFYNTSSLFDGNSKTNSINKNSKSKKHAYITDLDELEYKLNEFEVIKTKFPALHLPNINKRKKKKHSKTYKNTENTARKTPIKNYKIPLTLIPSESPSFIVSSNTSGHMGPGFYSLSYTEKPTGGIISLGPRFDND